MKPSIIYYTILILAILPVSNSVEFMCDFNNINSLQRSLDSNPQCELKVQNINRAVTKNAARFYKNANSKEFNSKIFCVDRNTFSVRHFEYALHFKLECSAEYPIQFEFQGLKPVDDITTYFHKVVKRNSNLTIASYNTVIDFDNKPKLTGKYIISSLINSSQKIEYYFFMESKAAILLHNRKIEQTLVLSDIALLPCRSNNWNASILLYKVKRQENEKISLSSHVLFDKKEGFMLDWTNVTHEEGQYLCAIDEGNEVHGDSLPISLILQQNITETQQLNSVESISLQVLNNSEALCEVNNNRTEFRPKSLNNIYIANPTQAKLQKECVFQGEYCLNTDQRVGGYKSHCMCLGIPQLERQGIVMCETEDKNVVQEYFIGLDGLMYCDSTLIPIPSSAVIQITSMNASKVDSTHYAFQTYAFECTISSYLLVKPIVWYRKLLNDTLIEERMNSDRGAINRPAWSDNLIMQVNPDTKEILCAASFWNNSVWVNSSVKLDVVVRRAPKIISSTPKILNFTANQKVDLICKADGYPMPTLRWLLGERVFRKSLPPEFRNRNLPQSAASRNFSLELKFFRITPNDSGMYSCMAENEFGKDRVNYTINVLEDTSSHSDSDSLGYQIAIRVPLGILISFGVVLAAYLLVKYKQRIGLNKQEIKEFEKGSEFEMKNMTGYVHETIDSQPYDRKFEIDENIHLDSTIILGAGAYGIVLKGRFRGQSVAIKTVKAGADKMYLKALLSELKIMIHIGKHPQIVSFLGAKTNELHKGIVYIIVEYCPMGNLENVLRNQNRSLFVLPNSVADVESDSTENPQTQEQEHDDSLCVCMKDLVLWSYQIACAMEHLISKKVIHGDLAARNVLLVNRETVKVTDFGLSRKLYECIDYVKKQQEPLPWRWLAIESLQSMHFSSKSDVWSFGVLLWEVFSLGDVPYPGLSWTVDFADLLDHGLRLKIPKYTTQDIFSIMQTCWANRPEDRPSFPELVQSFHAQLLRFSVDVYVELQDNAKIE